MKKVKIKHFSAAKDDFAKEWSAYNKFKNLDKSNPVSYSPVEKVTVPAEIILDNPRGAFEYAKEKMANKIKSYKQKNFSFKDKFINAAGKAVGGAAIIGGLSGLANQADNAKAEFEKEHPTITRAKNDFESSVKSGAYKGAEKGFKKLTGLDKFEANKPKKSEFQDSLDTSNVKIGDHESIYKNYPQDTVDFKKLAEQRKDLPEGWSFKATKQKEFSKDSFTLY